MFRRGSCLVLFTLLAGLLTPISLAQAGPQVTTQRIDGSGSSLAGNLVNVWTAALAATGLQIEYTATGSAQGRVDFGNSTADYAISDLPYQGVDPGPGNVDLPCPRGSTTNCRPYAYLPAAASATSFPYRLMVGGKMVQNLRLSARTLALIFTGQLHNWDDPAITADNNGRRFPSLPITPVVHSEGSGASWLFTSYLDHQQPSIWSAFNGSAGPTAYYPQSSALTSVPGSDGVANYVATISHNGSIGYDEYTYALARDLPVSYVENAAGYYNVPTSLNASIALTGARLNDDPSSSNYLTADLAGVFSNPDPRTYPLSAYSYLIMPTSATDPRMTTAKRQALAEFIHYGLCEGQGDGGPIGYSALPLNLVSSGLDQLALLEQADPMVDLTGLDLDHCANPTLDPANPGASQLDAIAPLPPACAHSGHGPCGLPEQVGLDPAPASVRFGDTVTLTGTAPASSVVSLYLHGLGDTGYGPPRRLTADFNGNFSFSYQAYRDQRYYLIDASSAGRPTGLAQITPTISNPASTHASFGSTVVLSGTAGLRSTVLLHFHRAGTPATDYSIVRSVPVDAGGHWARPFVLDPDYRVFATVGSQASPPVLFTSR